MKYAAVVMTTLCRYTHLVALLESLKRNTGAEYTEVFIALDYPALDSHWDGYNKIIQYVDHIEGFKQVHVHKRPYNYGPRRNRAEVIKVVEESFDRIIYTEDDNIFAPNFLEFVNKGLERYKDDLSVVAICGYRHFYNICFDDNNYYMQSSEFSAWGYGYWRDKTREIKKGITYTFFLNILRNPVKLYRAYKRGWNHLETLYDASRKTWDGSTKDTVYGEIIFDKGAKVVMPTVSKVRNMGWDGSGNIQETDENLIDVHHNQPLDNEKTFEYHGEDHYFKENAQVYAKESYARDKKWHVFVRVVFRVIFGG